jgi:hypothetical protein
VNSAWLLPCVSTASLRINGKPNPALHSNGGPATSPADSGVSEGPPSVS